MRYNAPDSQILPYANCPNQSNESPSYRRIAFTRPQTDARDYVDRKGGNDEEGWGFHAIFSSRDAEQ
jgi:hypothetical protein